MNKRGQSLIEYALIAILVITGVVLGGPYVLRSIDAHFKLWDDGAQVTGPSSVAGLSFQYGGTVHGCNGCYALVNVCCSN